jgi:hypothetical protein
MSGNEPAGEGDAAELLDELDELGPEGESAEDLDLNGCDNWEFVP